MKRLISALTLTAAILGSALAAEAETTTAATTTAATTTTAPKQVLQSSNACAAVSGAFWSVTVC